jgi:CDP-diglyceride synthetase
MAEVDGVPLPATVKARVPPRSAGLLKRVLSTLILLPVFLAIVMAGPVWLFGATVVLVAALGQWEFTGMFERAGIRTHRWLGLGAGIALTSSFALPVSEFGFTAIWLLGYGFWLRELPFGKEWVLLLVWVTWLGEAAAYLVGSSIGRHQLAPVLSPRKTIEGAVAQVSLSVVAALIGQAWFFGALPREHALLVGVMLGVAGQVGDLVESLLKRSVGTKDTGHLIPGHGGMLDRIDSLLFNTPVLFYYAAHGKALTS